jgi:hypothetical protein
MTPKENAGDIDILKPLFWDYDWASVKQNLLSPFVIARVLELGDPEQFRVLAKVIGDHAIKAFLIRKGKRLLSRRSYNFWQLFYRRHESTEQA